MVTVMMGRRRQGSVLVKGRSSEDACKNNDDDVNGWDEIRVEKERNSQERSLTCSNSMPSNGTLRGGYQRRGGTRAYHSKKQI